MSYFYQQTEPGCFTVGIYSPAGRFQPESDWSTGKEAAKRVRFLNGEEVKATASIRVIRDVDAALNKITMQTEERMNGCLVNTHQQVIDLNEEALRSGLIALGWTPPSAKPGHHIRDPNLIARIKVPTEYRCGKCGCDIIGGMDKLLAHEEICRF